MSSDARGNIPKREQAWGKSHDSYPFLSRWSLVKTASDLEGETAL